MGSMGSMEPINFQGRVLEPINILGNSIERWNLGNKIKYFQQFKDVWNPSILNPNVASDNSLILCYLCKRKGAYPITKSHIFSPWLVFDTKVIENDLQWFRIMTLMFF